MPLTALTITDDFAQILNSTTYHNLTMASGSDVSFLEYVGQALLDDDQDTLAAGGDGILLDPLALQAAERSFYEVLVAAPHSRPLSCVHDYALLPPETEAEENAYATTEAETGAEAEHSVSLLSPFPHSMSSSPANGCLVAISNGVCVDSSASCVTSLLASSNYILSGSDSVLQFQRGMEEASKFLPGGDIGPTRPKTSWKKCRLNAVTAEESGTEKQPADEQSELLESLFLRSDVATTALDPPSEIGGGNESKSQKKSHRKTGKPDNKYEVVDLENLLLLCARALAANDSWKTAELLKRIRQFSSPAGDGSQRLAHYFAQGLEARFIAAGTQLYTDHCSRLRSAEGVLKVYKSLLAACPSRKVSNHLATLYILKIAQKATTLHIIDFGILNGFQWPMLIQLLSTRPGGPPKLRITGIELPMPGTSWSTELVDQARSLLTQHCHRFNVPLEFNGISQQWETLRLDDLKIEADETIVVNCLFRFEELQDETVEDNNSPREAVVNLIGDIKPHMFIHGIRNGSLNTPLFFARFREALYDYSALFDMLDCVFDRDSEDRVVLEKDCYGWEVVNVTACEGAQRVFRPETRKQWQVRNARAGLEPLALEKEYMEKMRAQMDAYHRDFLLDEDGYWMLMGWKGRVLVAVSFWVPADIYLLNKVS